MLIRSDRDAFQPPRGNPVTPRALYQGRRALLQAWAAGAAGAALAPWAAREALAQTARPGKRAALPGARSALPGAVTMERLTAYDDVSSYNNFYEFGTDKGDPVRQAQRLRTDPWSVRIEGLVHKPGRLTLEELLRLAPMEERIYRLRCVEGWSMVIPWVGFPLNALLKQVEPLGSAKFVEFITHMDPATMPGLRQPFLDWPYTEGLRLDEALHPLTLMAIGLYGEELPNQNGAPLRLVVPWKYGFKSGKSIVKIRLTDKEPKTTWNLAQPEEYGFYANVNPDVDHPRWSQEKERRIGEFFKRKTLPFNGYAEQVAQLYAGMDLRKYY